MTLKLVKDALNLVLCDLQLRSWLIKEGYLERHVAGDTKGGGGGMRGSEV